MEDAFEAGRCAVHEDLNVHDNPYKGDLRTEWFKGMALERELTKDFEQALRAA